jgi:hypothetical protein
MPSEEPSILTKSEMKDLHNTSSAAFPTKAKVDISQQRKGYPRAKIWSKSTCSAINGSLGFTKPPQPAHGL